MLHDASIQLLLVITRASLWQKMPVLHASETALFSNLTDELWNETMKLSAEQSILAVAYDGLSFLPSAMQPPKSVLIKWAANADQAEKRGKHMLQTVYDLAAFYHSHQVSMLLLKGLGMAQFYPKYSLRRSSDIDVYLGGKYEEGNRLAEQYFEADINTKNKKHAIFRYKKWNIENHRTFLNDHLSHSDTILDKVLLQLLAEYPNEVLTLQPPKREEQSSFQSVCIPPVLFNAVFLLRHTATHFVSRTSLRDLADWACFLHHQHQLLDFDRLASILLSHGMMPFASVWTGLAVKLLDLPVQDTGNLLFSNTENPIPFSQAEYQAAIAEAHEMEDRVAQFMLRGRPAFSPSSLHLFKLIRLKYRRWADARWRYEFVYRISHLNRLWNLAQRYLKSPSDILTPR